MAETTALTEQFFDEMERDFFAALQFGDPVEDAINFLKNDWPKIEQGDVYRQLDDTLKVRIERIHDLYAVVAIPGLPEDDLVDLFRGPVSLYFTEPQLFEGVDILGALDSKMVTLDHEMRDQLKEKLRRALEANEEPIGEGQIVRDGSSYPTTTKEWLRDYISAVGVGDVSTIKRGEYLTQSPNLRAQPPEVRDPLLELFSTYEALKLSSFEVEGLEEPLVLLGDDDEDIVVLRKGRAERVDPKLIRLAKEIVRDTDLFPEAKAELLAADRGSSGAPPATAAVPPAPAPAPSPRPQPASAPAPPTPPEPKPAVATAVAGVAAKIQAAYAGDPKTVEAIGRASVKLSKSAGSDSGKLRQAFFTAVQRRDVPATVAALQMLVAADDLLRFVAEDGKLQQFLAATWADQYGASTVAEYRKSPDAPRFIKLFIRYVMEERLGQTPAQSAWVGARLAGQLADRGHDAYRGIAFYDVEADGFGWQP